jgi:transposase
LPYSSGAVEGTVNKMLKRQMFGRAKLDLLSASGCSSPNERARPGTNLDQRKWARSNSG